MLKHSLQGQEKGVSCVAISGDSRLIASKHVIFESIIKLWFADTGQHVCTFQGHEHGVWCLDFKGPSTLVSGGGDNTIKVWALSDGKAPALLHTLRGHSSFVLSVKVSPDGMKIASGSTDKTVMIWSMQSGMQLLRLTGHRDSVNCVAWSSDSRLVASGASDKTISVWDAAEGTHVIEPFRSGNHDVNSQQHNNSAFQCKLGLDYHNLGS
jgi:WD40 repeat protein